MEPQYWSLTLQGGCDPRRHLLGRIFTFKHALYRLQYKAEFSVSIARDGRTSAFAHKSPELLTYVCAKAAVHTTMFISLQIFGRHCQVSIVCMCSGVKIAIKRGMPKIQNVFRVRVYLMRTQRFRLLLRDERKRERSSGD